MSFEIGYIVIKDPKSLPFKRCEWFPVYVDDYGSTYILDKDEKLKYDLEYLNEEMVKYELNQKGKFNIEAEAGMFEFLKETFKDIPGTKISVGEKQHEI